MSKKVLLNIDYTNDFVSDDGALNCGKPGQKIENFIVNITERFIENGDDVVFAIDRHLEDEKYHPETKLYPPHNIVGTKGRELYGKLNDVWESNKNSNNVYWMDKTRYSAFVGTDLHLKLCEREIDEVHVVGCCTDICVLHTVIDAYAHGYRIVVHEEGVASFNQTGHAWALDHFKNCLNAKVVKE